VFQFLVAVIASGVLGGIFSLIWFFTSTPLDRLRSESRKRHWRSEIALDGLGYSIDGMTDGWDWHATWNGRLIKPLFELTVAEQQQTDNWLFLGQRNSRTAPNSILLDYAFNRNALPRWVLPFSQARELHTQTPEFDREFFLAAASEENPGRILLTPRLVSKLTSLPETIRRGLLIIRGGGELRIRIEGFQTGDEYVSIDEICQLASEVKEHLKLG
jgi:hypothetical protein